MKSFIILGVLVISFSAQAQVAVGTSTPAASAQFEISSTTKGFLPPRMTQAQRNAIVSPVQGLMVFCTDCGTNYQGEPQFYTGAAWVNMIGAPAAAPPPSNTICGAVWSTTNLNVDHYRNGDPIPQVTDNAEWAALTTGAWCWYNNDSATYAATYGKLYNWYAISDPRGLAPAGWHIPTDTEWTTLVNCLGGDLLAGGPLKETGLVHWQTPNAGATNTTGYTALPYGRRGPAGEYADIFIAAHFWTATEYTSGVNGNSYADRMQYNVPYVTRGDNGKRNGYAVRCVRD